MLVLVVVALWLLCGLFYEAICFKYCLVFLYFFSPFSIVITLLGEERANLGAFRAFVRFELVWFCLFFSFSSSCLGWTAACDCGTPWTVH